MQHNGQLDPCDIKILDLLQKHARLDVSKISLAVHKSESAVRERLREHGYIKRFTALLDRNLMGRPTLMITLVKLNGHSATALQDFAKAMCADSKVQLQII